MLPRLLLEARMTILSRSWTLASSTSCPLVGAMAMTHTKPSTFYVVGRHMTTEAGDSKESRGNVSAKGPRTSQIKGTTSEAASASKSEVKEVKVTRRRAAKSVTNPKVSQIKPSPYPLLPDDDERSPLVRALCQDPGLPGVNKISWLVRELHSKGTNPDELENAYTVYYPCGGGSEQCRHSTKNNSKAALDMWHHSADSRSAAVSTMANRYEFLQEVRRVEYFDLVRRLEVMVRYAANGDDLTRELNALEELCVRGIERYSDGTLLYYYIVSLVANGQRNRKSTFDRVRSLLVRYPQVIELFNIVIDEPVVKKKGRNPFPTSYRRWDVTKLLSDLWPDQNFPASVASKMAILKLQENDSYNSAPQTAVISDSRGEDRGSDVQDQTVKKSKLQTGIGVQDHAIKKSELETGIDVQDQTVNKSKLQAADEGDRKSKESISLKSGFIMSSIAEFSKLDQPVASSPKNGARNNEVSTDKDPKVPNHSQYIHPETGDSHQPLSQPTEESISDAAPQLSQSQTSNNSQDDVADLPLPLLQEMLDIRVLECLQKGDLRGAVSALTEEAAKGVSPTTETFALLLQRVRSDQQLLDDLKEVVPPQSEAADALFTADTELRLKTNHEQCWLAKKTEEAVGALLQIYRSLLESDHIVQFETLDRLLKKTNNYLRLYLEESMAATKAREDEDDGQPPVGKRLLALVAEEGASLLDSHGDAAVVLVYWEVLFFAAEFASQQRAEHFLERQPKLAAQVDVDAVVRRAERYQDESIFRRILEMCLKFDLDEYDKKRAFEGLLMYQCDQDLYEAASATLDTALSLNVVLGADAMAAFRDLQERVKAQKPTGLFSKLFRGTRK